MDLTRAAEWEWVLCLVSLTAGLLSGYVAGRLHARARQAQRDRERAVDALAGGGDRDWQKRAAEAEATAIKLAGQALTYASAHSMAIAEQIRKAHQGGR